jgi:citrate lyase subunit beta / citryl-CoA lyase
MLEKATAFAADALVLDLEDSVPEHEKDAARGLVRDSIPRLLTAGRELWVRVNSTYTGRARDDVRSVIQPGIAGILLPKADTPEIVRYADAIIREAERLAGLETGMAGLIAHIESAGALLRATEIARASTRVRALAFGGEDYAADMRLERTEGGEELSFPRHMVAVAARAAGVLAIDTVFPYLHDLDALVRDARAGRRAGYAGKLLIHPEQIEPVAAVFTPSDDELRTARQRVQAYDEALNAGQGAIDVDGVMVDAPVAKRARELLELAGEAVAS